MRSNVDNVVLQDSDGYTAQDLAQAAGHDELIELLNPRTTGKEESDER